MRITKLYNILASSIFATMIYFLASEIIPTSFTWNLPEFLHPLKPVDANTTSLLAMFVGFIFCFITLPILTKGVNNDKQ